VGEPSDQELMGAAEIARRLDVSPGRVHQILAADPTFPKPRAVLSMGKVWTTTDVEAWIAEHRPGKAEGNPS
jgi:predicted DNA-binding transcriptional regulator AlpA